MGPQLLPERGWVKEMAAGRKGYYPALRHLFQFPKKVMSDLDFNTGMPDQTAT